MALTEVRLGNGKITSFWHDRWLLGTSLADTFPALYSHCTTPHLSVSASLAVPMDTLLRPRLTRCASEEKQMVQDYLHPIALIDYPDSRVLVSRPRKSFDTRDVPRAPQVGLSTKPDALRIWQTKLPTKVCFFAWLLYLNRLNTGASMFHRNIEIVDESYCEDYSCTLETGGHIFTGLGPDRRHDETDVLWTLGQHFSLQQMVHLDVILLIL